VAEARQQLRLRDLLTARPTSLQYIDFVKVSSPMTVASMQVEGSDKAENAVTFTTASQKVETVAHWLPCTAQALQDSESLRISSTTAFFTTSI
jgi:HK97 family phage major capsid protein